MNILRCWRVWIVLAAVVFTFEFSDNQVFAKNVLDKNVRSQSSTLLKQRNNFFKFNKNNNYLTNTFLVDYVETFSTAGKGVPVNPICNNDVLNCCTMSNATSCPGNDFTGVDWLLYSLDGTEWGRFAGSYWDSGDYFVTTGAGVLESIDLDDDICWQSPVLVTTVTGTSAFTADLTWTGFDVGADDEINVEYSLNGGGFIRHPNVLGANGDPGSTIKYTAGGGDGAVTTNFPAIAITSGDTMRVRVCFDTNSNAEVVTLDNVMVTNFAPIAPTAAGVTISGRVLSSSGRGIARSAVLITDSNGNIRTTRTNQFGYYSFEGIEAGQTLVINVYSKGYQFRTQVVTLDDSIANLDFIAQYRNTRDSRINKRQ